MSDDISKDPYFLDLYAEMIREMYPDQQSQIHMVGMGTAIGLYDDETASELALRLCPNIDLLETYITNSIRNITKEEREVARTMRATVEKTIGLPRDQEEASSSSDSISAQVLRVIKSIDTFLRSTDPDSAAYRLLDVLQHLIVESPVTAFRHGDTFVHLRPPYDGFDLRPNQLIIDSIKIPLTDGSLEFTADPAYGRSRFSSAGKDVHMTGFDPELESIDLFITNLQNLMMNNEQSSLVLTINDEQFEVPVRQITITTDPDAGFDTYDTINFADHFKLCLGQVGMGASSPSRGSGMLFTGELFSIRAVA